MTKRHRTSATSAAPAGSARPDKLRRVEYAGWTIENPIVLDDSDNDGETRDPWLPSNYLNDEDFNSFLAGHNGTSAFSPAIPTPGSTSDEIEELDISPTKLFYHEGSRPTANLPAMRTLAIQTKQDISGKAKQTSLFGLSPGWPVAKPSRVVNIYLEGAAFDNSLFERFSHLHLRTAGATDLEKFCVRDLRKELARILDIEDGLSIQIEIQHARAIAGSRFFTDGVCSRPNAAWNVVTVDDRTELSKAFPTNEAWIRLRIAEHLKVKIASKDMTVAITPPAQAKIREVRELVATITEVSPGAVSLFVDRAEISDEMGILCRWGLDTQTDITATIETRECSNCLDEVGASDFPFQPTTDDCVHDLDTCKQCITTWIGTSLDNGNWKNITCLSVDCGAVLQYADVKRNSSDTDMERYERFATRDALSTMPGFRWCLNPECSAGQIHDGDEAGTAILTCEVCDFKRCTLCERAWHQDETCDQYTQRLAAQPGEIDASEAWVANNSRKCPGCQSPIQKNDGCDHMTCTRCRRQFCWLCQADYADIHREGNTAHKEGCRYKSGAVIDPHAPPIPLPRRVAVPRVGVVPPVAPNAGAQNPVPAGHGILAHYARMIPGFGNFGAPALNPAQAGVQNAAPAPPGHAVDNADEMQRQLLVQNRQQLVAARRAQLEQARRQRDLARAARRVYQPEQLHPPPIVPQAANGHAARPGNNHAFAHMQQVDMPNAPPHGFEQMHVAVPPPPIWPFGAGNSHGMAQPRYPQEPPPNYFP